MFRHSTEVTEDDITSLVSRLDPTAPGYSAHLTFDRILGRCGLAWTAFLTELGGEELAAGVIAPHVEVDYHREVGAGSLEVDVTVLSVGRTSFRVRCAASQDGEPAATAEVVLVRFDYDSRSPVALTEVERALLEK